MLYNIVLFVHILGAVLMFMAMGILFTAMISMLHAKEKDEVQRWSALAVKLDGLMPLSILLIIAPALYLVFSSWGWDYAWINVSLVLVAAMSVMGPMINLRRLKGIVHTAQSEAGGAPSAALLSKVRDRLLWNSVSVMSMLSVGILFLMAVKLPLLGSLVTTGFAVIAGLLLANVLLAKFKPADTTNPAIPG